MPLQPSDEAVQIAWHSDPKLLDFSKKKSRKGTTYKEASTVQVKKKRKHGQGHNPTF